MDSTVTYNIPYSIGVDNLVVLDSTNITSVGYSVTSDFADESDDYILKEIGTEVDYNSTLFQEGINYESKH